MSQRIYLVSGYKMGVVLQSMNPAVSDRCPEAVEVEQVKTFTRKLVTIVTEALIEERLMKELGQLGVQGFTITDARGRGERGVRDAHHEFAANIRIEIICNESVAEAVERHLVEHYFPNFAVIWFTTDVEVLRGDKF